MSNILNSICYKISKCNKCDLHKNGQALPFLGKNAKYIIIAEAPGADEIKLNSPLVGKTGIQLFKWLDSIGYSRNDFLIFNSVNCRPIIKTNNKIKNGKPTKSEIKTCYKYNMALIYHSDIIRIITLGDYAKFMFTRTLNDMNKFAGKNIKFKLKDKKLDIFFNYHPSYAFIYNKNKLSRFKEIFRRFLE